MSNFDKAANSNREANSDNTVNADKTYNNYMNDFYVPISRIDSGCVVM